LNCPVRKPAERLGHVVVGAEQEPGDAVDLVAPGGEEDDRHVQAVLADRPADLRAADPREVDVEHREVDLAAKREGDRRRAVAGRADVEARRRQLVHDQREQVGVVVDDEYLPGHRSATVTPAGLKRSVGPALGTLSAHCTYGKVRTSSKSIAVLDSALAFDRGRWGSGTVRRRPGSER
jgi:hypothetical protein